MITSLKQASSYAATFTNRLDSSVDAFLPDNSVFLPSSDEVLYRSPLIKTLQSPYPITLKKIPPKKKGGPGEKKGFSFAQGPTQLETKATEVAMSKLMARY